jgi:hypothetical protein
LRTFTVVPATTACTRGTRRHSSLMISVRRSIGSDLPCVTSVSHTTTLASALPRRTIDESGYAVPQSSRSSVGVTTLSGGASPSISMVPVIVPLVESATGLYATLGSAIAPTDGFAVLACAVLSRSLAQPTALQIDKESNNVDLVASPCARVRRKWPMASWCTRDINLRARRMAELARHAPCDRETTPFVTYADAMYVLVACLTISRCFGNTCCIPSSCRWRSRAVCR